MIDKNRFMRPTREGAPKGVYLSGEGWKAGDIEFIATGEYRSPAKGEWYLSGAIIAAYMAGGDLFSEYWIAQAYKLKPNEIYHDGHIYVRKANV